METKVKRLAQFLFDNAGEIIEVLKKSPNYRALSVSLDMFKTDEKPKLDVNLSLYDALTTHYYLGDGAVCIERFKQLCAQMNSETGATPPPEPVEVREKL